MSESSFTAESSWKFTWDIVVHVIGHTEKGTGAVTEIDVQECDECNPCTKERISETDHARRQARSTMVEYTILRTNLASLHAHCSIIYHYYIPQLYLNYTHIILYIIHHILQLFYQMFIHILNFPSSEQTIPPRDTANVILLTHHFVQGFAELRGHRE